MSNESVLADARALIAEGQSAAALTVPQTGRLRYPDHGGIALLSADTLQVSGQLREAVVAYTVALRIDDVSTDGWFGAGCAHLALNATGTAAACFARADALAPRSGPVLYSLAKSLFELGRVESAISLFEQAEGLDPEVAEMAQASIACIACIIPGSSRADHAAVLKARRRWAKTAAMPVSTTTSPRSCATTSDGSTDV